MIHRRPRPRRPRRPPVATPEPPPVATPEPTVAKLAPPVAKPEPPPLALAKTESSAPLALAKTESSAPLALATAHAAPPPASPPVPSFSERERPEVRERRLRDIIIAHGREMKGCVDRQLKLMPDLRADGLLVIEVDADGTVPGAELQGADLAGTALESCLQMVTSRWRFPRSGRGYRIEAPLKVSGS